MKNAFLLVFMTLTFFTQAQVAHQPSNLVACDEDNDGIEVFDLTQTYLEILLDQDPLDFLIYFFESQADADSGFNAIVPDFSYVNIDNPQTIYVRLEEAATGNFDTTSFELILEPTPIIGTGPFSMELCDDLLGGSTSIDEVSTFNLTQMNDVITLGDSSLFVLYYESAADQNSNNSIDPDTAYQNVVNPQTIYVSVFNGAGCEARTFLTLTVIPNPSPMTPTPLVTCDDDNDGFSAFILTDKDAEIAGGEPNVTITYHETFLNAETGIFPLAVPYENVTPFLEIVYARVTSDLFGCFTIVELQLVVSPIPDEPTIEFGDLAVLDEDNDDEEAFDLTQNEAFLIGTQDVSNFLPITYYTSLADAVVSQNAIANPSNFVSMGQTIWTRLEFIASGCYRIDSFELFVLSFEDFDSDGDGVPNGEEDLNGNGNYDDDDTDDDTIPNYLDDDDDGDSVDTIIEITGIGGGFSSDFIDTDEDLIENYLDDDDDGDNVLTIDEDYNDNGTPLDDDINENNIPDFLDAEVALGIGENEIVVFTMFPNPAQNIITIASEALIDNTVISIYNVVGRKMFSEETTPIHGQCSFDVQSLGPGVYFVKVQSGNFDIVKKIIKQ